MTFIPPDQCPCCQFSRTDTAGQLCAWCSLSNCTDITPWCWRRLPDAQTVTFHTTADNAR